MILDAGTLPYLGVQRIDAAALFGPALSKPVPFFLSYILRMNRVSPWTKLLGLRSIAMGTVDGN